MIPIAETLQAIRNVQPDMIVMVNMTGNDRIALQKLTQLNAMLHPWPRVVEALACSIHALLDLGVDVGKEADVDQEEVVRQVMEKLQEYMGTGPTHSHEFKRLD